MNSTDTSPRVRLLAVLAADAAGYARLMSLDDHGTVAALDASRAVFSAEVAKHSGRVVDLAGDSVLAVFETATAAVQAALAVQRRLDEPATPEISEDRRMRFRIGVHLGDVIEKADGSVYGDGVNIAARLQALAFPGHVTVSESVRITVKGRVPAGFEDQGEQRVKHIADPVRAYRLVALAPGEMSAEGSAPLATTAPADSADADWHRQPGIAVLPFTNASDSPEHAFIADGLADDIIGSLATVRGLVVIARSSTFTYKGRPADARTVGHELGVRYVVEGTLRVMAQQLRLNVRLIDCQSNSSLWSERFDAPLEELFAIQDEVTARIMNSVRATVDQSEARKSRTLDPRTLQTWQLRVQATELYHRWNRVDMLEAIELSRRAIELAPEEASGHGHLAASLWAAAISGWMPPGVAAIEEALAQATRAINLDEGLSYAHNIMASVLVGLGRHDEALAAAERCLELTPGDFAANSQRGQTLAFAGRYEEALPFLDRALRLSPRDPMIYWVYQSRSLALFGLERYEEAIAAAQRVSRQLPEWVHAHTMLAAAFMGLGELQRAAQAIQAAVKLNPRLTVRRTLRHYSLRNLADVARLAGFLRDAGLPEN